MMEKLDEMFTEKVSCRDYIFARVDNMVKFCIGKKLSLVVLLNSNSSRSSWKGFWNRTHEHRLSEGKVILTTGERSRNGYLFYNFQAMETKDLGTFVGLFTQSDVNVNACKHW